MYEHVEGTEARGPAGANGVANNAANHAESDAVDAVPAEPHMRTERGRFTRAGASEAARARWNKQRAQDTPSEVPDADVEDDVRTVVVPARIGAIIRSLEKAALKGNSNAARELRSWLSEYPPSDGSVSVEELDRRTRDRILARLLAELEDEDANAESSEDEDDRQDQSHAG
jgi:hypothetical protein